MQENAGKRQAATLEDKSKGLQEGLLEAAARDSEHFRGWNGFKGLRRLTAGLGGRYRQGFGAF